MCSSDLGVSLLMKIHLESVGRAPLGRSTRGYIQFFLKNSISSIMTCIHNSRSKISMAFSNVFRSPLVVMRAQEMVSSMPYYTGLWMVCFGLCNATPLALSYKSAMCGCLCTSFQIDDPPLWSSISVETCLLISTSK